ncbi:MAG TPA: response regulator transcription factor [Fibrobacteria bacterium]|jgi:two-component system phosphate regulon response regulator PhoB|nr:response regulator transcription factor [Fibrobacteria bacterium]
MDGTSVLVTEDNADILELVTYGLEAEGFRVYGATTGQDALSILRDETIDLAVLDVMLPDISGTEICRRMKRDERLERIPVIFLTARNEETDKLVGFKVGADDYVTKPFSPKELVARVHALIRRVRGGDDYVFRGLRVTIDSHRVEVDGARVHLSPREFSLLKVLLEAKPKTVDRSTLLERGWGMEAKSGLRSVDVAVTRLRDKIKPYGACIRTVTGFGYQWDTDGFAAS